ncbi:hypothetical protein [Streptosporangium sp. CA-115845]|uniref:hypothetical protein n=1 Tax=Streptosporangium sp. CA-115845 TaxID=3240071 RepID=UPI003D93A7B6
MNSPRVPDDLDMMLLLADAMGGGDVSSAIERQEKQAQRELVNSTVIPTEILSGSEEELTALGFKLGAVVEGDPLFRHAELPTGWKREGSDHAMGSYIVDELGRRRCSVFFKGAFYDRKAHLGITSVYGYLSDCLYEDAAPVLDDSWATREVVLKTLGEIRQSEQEGVDRWAGGSESYAAEYEAEHREKLAKIEALRSSFAEQTPGGAA